MSPFLGILTYLHLFSSDERRWKKEIIGPVLFQEENPMPISDGKSVARASPNSAQLVAGVVVEVGSSNILNNIASSSSGTVELV